MRNNTKKERLLFSRQTNINFNLPIFVVSNINENLYLSLGEMKNSQRLRNLKIENLATEKFQLTELNSTIKKN